MHCLSDMLKDKRNVQYHLVWPVELIYSCTCLEALTTLTVFQEFVKVFKIEESTKLSFSEDTASYKYPPLQAGGLQAAPNSLWDPDMTSASIPPGKAGAVHCGFKKWISYPIL